VQQMNAGVIALKQESKHENDRYKNKDKDKDRKITKVRIRKPYQSTQAVKLLRVTKTSKQNRKTKNSKVKHVGPELNIIFNDELDGNDWELTQVNIEAHGFQIEPEKRPDWLAFYQNNYQERTLHDVAAEPVAQEKLAMADDQEFRNVLSSGRVAPMPEVPVIAKIEGNGQVTNIGKNVIASAQGHEIAQEQEMELAAKAREVEDALYLAEAVKAIQAAPVVNGERKNAVAQNVPDPRLQSKNYNPFLTQVNLPQKTTSVIDRISSTMSGPVSGSLKGLAGNRASPTPVLLAQAKGSSQAQNPNYPNYPNYPVSGINKSLASSKSRNLGGGEFSLAAPTIYGKDQKGENIFADLGLTEMVFKKGGVSQVKNFRFVPHYDDSLSIADNKKGFVEIEFTGSRSHNVLSGTIYKDGFVKTVINLFLEEGEFQYFVPMFEIGVMEKFLDDEKLEGSGGIVLVEFSENTLDVEIDGGYEKKIYLSDTFAKGKLTDHTAYAIFVGVDPGNRILTSINRQQKETYKIIHAEDQEILFEIDDQKIVKGLKYEFFEDDIFGPKGRSLSLKPNQLVYFSSNAQPPLRVGSNQFEFSQLRTSFGGRSYF
jgi:hypothetical protein